MHCPNALKEVKENKDVGPYPIHDTFFICLGCVLQNRNKRKERKWIEKKGRKKKGKK